MLTLGTGVLVLAMSLAPARATTMKERTGDSDSLPKSHATPTPDSTPPAKQNSDAQARLLKTFSSYVGIKEEPLGSNNGRMVNIFNQSCGLDPSEHAPWCAAVANYGYKVNGLKGNGAYSPSWFSKSRRVDQGHVDKADVALVFFPSKGRYAHTIAAVEKVTWSAGRVVQVTTLEGNTNAQGSREGDQFARRIRSADTLTFVRWWNQ